MSHIVTVFAALTFAIILYLLQLFIMLVQNISTRKKQLLTIYHAIIEKPSFLRHH